MGKHETQRPLGDRLDRRRFLGGAAAVAGAGLLAAGGQPTAAAAAEAPLVDATLLEDLSGPSQAMRATAAKNYGDFKRGTVQANGLNFSYVEIGEGPLALCLHGYPDSPFTWRYLMPELAKAGYRAVCYWNRGYYPSDAPPPRLPADPKDAGDYQAGTIVQDVLAIRDALGGDEESVLICHDWGALCGWGAGSERPDAFRRLVIMNVPPLAVFSPMLLDYGQVRRSFYFWWLQMDYSNEAYSKDNFAFPAQLMEDWAAGYDSREEAYHHRLCYDGGRRQDHVLGSYRNLFSAENFFVDPKFIADQTEWWGSPVAKPVLYLHGTNDGCITLPDQYRQLIPPFIPNPQSRIEMVQGVGHYLMVQRPQYVNKLVLDFLAER